MQAELLELVELFRGLSEQQKQSLIDSARMMSKTHQEKPA